MEMEDKALSSVQGWEEHRVVVDEEGGGAGREGGAGQMDVEEQASNIPAVT